ncbi:MAG: tetratricopeptide repeat protein, partial [Bacteroidales bacterium]|nr:tetratricopeptide repeat protein [Bacteroidales bacterium]
ATDFMQRAMAKDPSLAAEAQKNIARYRQYFPKAEDAFMYDLVDGKGYSVSCGGMSASTTVRTLK